MKNKEKKIKVEFTPNQWKAVMIAFAELSNTGEWAEHYDDEQIENVMETISYVEELNEFI